ncbi:MAG: hypothetical protein A2Y40_10910 [Candidatus Margulisbacteria bacterium GWF2_35_9]|nr:MAG: hypothetical protein A2Y40_10910 [Candidatus Margulisbacteria bacterium GWF2_35_9]
MLGALPMSPKRTIFTFGQSKGTKEDRNHALEKEVFEILGYGSLTRGTLLLNASFYIQKNHEDLNKGYTYAMGIKAYKENPGHKLCVKIEDRILGLIKSYNLFSRANTNFTAAIDFDKKIAKIFDDGICFPAIGRNQISILFLNPELNIKKYKY